MSDNKKTEQTKLPKPSSTVSDNTTTPKKDTNYLFEEYTDMFTMRQRPASIEFIENTAKQLTDWACNCKEAFKLTQFYQLRGISSTDIKRWEERCPELKKAHAFALQALGNRREIGALKKKYDAGIVSTTMPHYDQDWKALFEWKAAISKKDENENNGTQVVVIERFPDSKDVPKKKED